MSTPTWQPPSPSVGPHGGTSMAQYTTSTTPLHMSGHLSLSPYDYYRQSLVLRSPTQVLGLKHPMRSPGDPRSIRVGTDGGVRSGIPRHRSEKSGDMNMSGILTPSATSISTSISSSEVGHGEDWVNVHTHTHSHDDLRGGAGDWTDGSVLVRTDGTVEDPHDQFVEDIEDDPYNQFITVAGPGPFSSHIDKISSASSSAEVRDGTHDEDGHGGDIDDSDGSHRLPKRQVDPSIISALPDIDLSEIYEPIPLPTAWCMRSSQDPSSTSSAPASAPNSTSSTIHSSNIANGLGLSNPTESLRQIAKDPILLSPTGSPSLASHPSSSSSSSTFQPSQPKSSPLGLDSNTDDLVMPHPRREYILPPVTDSLVHFTIYETMFKTYIVGSNAAQTVFRLLKIDRALPDPTELRVSEDGVAYDQAGMHSSLHMIAESSKPHGGLARVATGHALLGFVRFVYGYYLHLATQAHVVARISGHDIYTVDEAVLVPLWNPLMFYESPVCRYSHSQSSLSVLAPIPLIS